MQASPSCVWAWVLLCACTVALAYYPDVEPALDVDGLVRNETALHEYIDCYLDKAPCGLLMSAYKRAFFTVVRSACERCSPGQRHNLALTVRAARERYPAEFELLRHVFDPDGTRFDVFWAELNKN